MLRKHKLQNIRVVNVLIQHFWQLHRGEIRVANFTSPCFQCGLGLPTEMNLIGEMKEKNWDALHDSMDILRTE